MERLTFEGRFCDLAMCQEPTCPYPVTGCSHKQVWERLKEYEDTGLTPEEVSKFVTPVVIASDSIGITRLCELLNSDKMGLVTIMSEGTE